MNKTKVTLDGGSGKEFRLDEPASPTPSVLLMGFYGRGNYGDDLMCTALADTLLHAGYRVFVVSSDTASFANLRAKAVTVIPRKLSNVISALRKTKVLCQGGGTNFHDSYQGKYLVRQWKNLMMWTGLFWVARMLGVRVIILGAGMGPLRHPVSRAITRLACAACTAVGVRDQASVDELKSLGTRTYFELGFDLAALPSPAAISPEWQQNTVGVLGVSACSLTPFLGDAQLNREYWQTLGDALAQFVARTPVKIIFFSLFTGASSESDDAVIDMIVARLPQGTLFDRYSYHGDVEAYGALFSKCNWFLGTKYHALLSAYLAGCSCAVVSYNRKMTDLAEDIRLPLDRRVSADKVQPVRRWLQVLESLTQKERNGTLLLPCGG